METENTYTLDRVYFMVEENDLSVIKIGKSGDEKRRRGQLQTGNPSKLVVMFSMVGGFSLEREFHHRFKFDRIMRGGQEWYRVTPKLLDFVREKMGQIFEPSFKFSPNVKFGDGPSRLESVEMGSVEYPTKPPVQIFEQSQPYSTAEVSAPKNCYTRLAKRKIK